MEHPNEGGKGRLPTESVVRGSCSSLDLPRPDSSNRDDPSLTKEGKNDPVARRELLELLGSMTAYTLRSWERADLRLLTGFDSNEKSEFLLECNAGANTLHIVILNEVRNLTVRLKYKTRSLRFLTPLALRSE